MQIVVEKCTTSSVHGVYINLYRTISKRNIQAKQHGGNNIFVQYLVTKNKCSALSYFHHANIVSKPQWQNPRPSNFHSLNDFTIYNGTTEIENSRHIGYIFSKILFFHKISHINLVEFSVAKNSSKVIGITICFAGCAWCSNFNSLPSTSNNVSSYRILANYSSGISVSSSGPSGCTTSNL